MRGRACANPAPCTKTPFTVFELLIMTSCTPEITCNASRNSLRNIVVLGIGNVLWADEGFGVRCVEALQQRYDFAEHVQLVDGGTQGMALLSYVQEADALLILDAIDYGLPPGTLKEVRGSEVPCFLGAKKMSLHQTGFQEVLMVAQLTGKFPAQIALIGCQPQELEDYGGSLRASTKHALEAALGMAVAQLQDWGACPMPRNQAVVGEHAVTVPNLGLAVYESGRPSAEQACRIGDHRFMV